VSHGRTRGFALVTFLALVLRSTLASNSSTSSTDVFEGPFTGMGITGWNDLGQHDVSNPSKCMDLCLLNARCKSFDYGAFGSVEGECWLSTGTRASVGAAYEEWRGYNYYERVPRGALVLPSTEQVKVSITVEGIDYALFSQSASRGIDLLSSFKAAVLIEIAVESGVPQSAVTLAVSAGSVEAAIRYTLIEVTIRVPTGVNIDDLISKMSTRSKLGASIDRALILLPGVDAVSNGPIGVSGIHASKATEDSNMTSTSSNGVRASVNGTVVEKVTCSMTADDALEVAYVDGFTVWRRGRGTPSRARGSIEFMSDAKVLAIKAYDFHAGCGSGGLRVICRTVSGTSDWDTVGQEDAMAWRVWSSRIHGYANEPTRWQSDDYDDSKWPRASVSCKETSFGKKNMLCGKNNHWLFRRSRAPPTLPEPACTEESALSYMKTDQGWGKSFRGFHRQSGYCTCDGQDVDHRKVHITPSSGDTCDKLCAEDPDCFGYETGDGIAPNCHLIYVPTAGGSGYDDEGQNRECFVRRKYLRDEDVCIFPEKAPAWLLPVILLASVVGGFSVIVCLIMICHFVISRRRKKNGGKTEERASGAPKACENDLRTAPAASPRPSNKITLGVPPPDVDQHFARPDQHSVAPLVFGQATDVEENRLNSKSGLIQPEYPKTEEQGFEV